jgi:hypothetical protein
MKFVISTNIVTWYKWTSFMNHVKSLIFKYVINQILDKQSISIGKWQVMWGDLFFYKFKLETSAI